MSEVNIEVKVGDILTRKRLISSLLYESCDEVAYGPLTLRMLEDNEVIQPVDFDGRVYPTIELLDTDDSEKQINHLVTEVDNTVRQVYTEL